MYNTNVFYECMIEQQYVTSKVHKKNSTTTYDLRRYVDQGTSTIVSRYCLLDLAPQHGLYDGLSAPVAEVAVVNSG